jgi:hypothetical protein
MLCAARCPRQTVVERENLAWRSKGGRWQHRGVSPKKRRAQDDPLAAYKRIREPMPPPERIERDRRRELEEERARREIDEAREGRS